MRKFRLCLLALLAISASVGAFAQKRPADGGYKFWKHKKTMQIHYSNHTMLNKMGGEESAAFSLGMVRFRSIYLHREPIAQRVKLGMDIGLGMHVAHFGGGSEQDRYGMPSHYEGPLGYVGSAPLVNGDAEDEMMALPNIGTNQLDLGLKIGPSVTVNPIDDLRVMAYYHVAPSMSLYNAGVMDISYSFVPFLEYGLEVTYRAFGVGMEIAEGIGNYKSIIPLLESLASSDEEDAVTTNTKIDVPGMPLATKALRFYIAFRF